MYTDPKNAPQLIGKDGKTLAGTAYVGKDGTHTILVNTEADENGTRSGIIGTIAEEGSHIVGKVEGSQRKTGTEELGLESTGRATNQYFQDKYKDNDVPIKAKSDGKDYSSRDFGEHVGDDRGACRKNGQTLLNCNPNTPAIKPTMAGFRGMDDRGSKDYRNAKETLKDIEKYCKASDKCKKENGVYIFSTKEEFDKYDSLFKKVGIRDKIKLDYTKPSSTFYSTGSGFFTKTDKEENKVVDKGISTQKTGGKSYTSDFGYIEPKSECGLYAEKCKFWTTVNWATMGLVVGGTMGVELIGGPGTVEKIVTESAIGKGIQKGVDKAADFLTKKPETTQIVNGFTNEQIREMSLDNLRKIGSSEATSSNAIRMLEGTKEEALKFFESRVVGKIDTIVNSGGKVIKVGFDKFGNKLTYRDFSVINGSYPTIELFKGDTGSWVTKIKFQ